jgi:hypothetical protein
MENQIEEKIVEKIVKQYQTPDGKTFWNKGQAEEYIQNAENLAKINNGSLDLDSLSAKILLASFGMSKDLFKKVTSEDSTNKSYYLKELSEQLTAIEKEIKRRDIKNSFDYKYLVLITDIEYTKRFSALFLAEDEDKLLEIINERIKDRGPILNVYDLQSKSFYISKQFTFTRIKVF